MRFHRCVFVAVLCTASAFVLAGGVHKIDDSTIDGQITAFDGKTIAIERKDENHATVRDSIALEDVMQVQLTSAASAPSSTQPTTRKADSEPATAQPGQPPSKSAVAGLLRLVGLKSIADDSGDSDETPPVDSSPAQPRGSRRSATGKSTQPTTLPDTWQIVLTNDDVLRGQLRSWADQHIAVQHPSASGSLEIPADHIAEMWHAPSELEQKARALAVEAKAGEDVAYVLKDGDVVAVSGIALGIEDESLAFRYDGEDRKIGLSRLLGVRLSGGAEPRSTRATSAFHQVLHLSSGDSLSGRWTSLRDGSVALNTSWNQAITIPVSAVVSIDNRNGRVVYLSDLKATSVEQTPYFDRVVSWRADVSLDGGPLMLSDGQYARGVAMHSRCALSYSLAGGDFERFRSRVGFEQPSGTIGRASISLMLDGKPLYENNDARGDQKPIDIDVDLEGGQTLTLLVDFGRDQDAGDRVIWASARLLRSSVGK